MQMNGLRGKIWGDEYPIVSRIGQVYQAAAQLYAVLSLGSSLLDPDADAGPDGGLDERLQSQLLTLIKGIWNLIKNPVALAWPFLVAGVAAADATRGDDRKFIEVCLQRTAGRP